MSFADLIYLFLHSQRVWSVYRAILLDVSALQDLLVYLLYQRDHTKFYPTYHCFVSRMYVSMQVSINIVCWTSVCFPIGVPQVLQHSSVSYIENMHKNLIAPSSSGSWLPATRSKTKFSWMTQKRNLLDLHKIDEYVYMLTGLKPTRCLISIFTVNIGLVCDLQIQVHALQLLPFTSINSSQCSRIGAPPFACDAFDRV